MLKFGAVILMAGMLILGVSPLCTAEGTEVAPAEHSVSPATKLANGLGNALTGWMEIPRQMAEVTNEQNAFAGSTIGLVKGLVFGTGRTAAGVIDTGTFVIPPYDKPIVEPNYNL